MSAALNLEIGALVDPGRWPEARLIAPSYFRLGTGKYLQWQGPAENGAARTDLAWSG
jgi:hypothetical protein